MNEVAPAPAPALIGCRQQQIRDAAPPWRARPGPLLQRPSLPTPGSSAPAASSSPVWGMARELGGGRHPWDRYWSSRESRFPARCGAAAWFGV